MNMILLGFEMNQAEFDDILNSARDAVAEEVDIQRQNFAEKGALPPVLIESVMANSKLFVDAMMISPDAALLGNFFQLAVAHTMLREALDKLAALTRPGDKVTVTTVLTEANGV